MIEKNIHFCWFGKKQISKKNLENINICSKINTDYTIKVWGDEILDDNNFFNSYVEKCLQLQKLANLSNYARIFLIKKYGGFYLDVDIRCIKPFNELINHFNKSNNIYAFESPDNKTYINNAVFAGKSENEFLKLCYNNFVSQFDGTEEANISSPIFMTNILKNTLADTIILPREYFYPYYYNEAFTENCITENTFCIHEWDRNW